METAPANVGIAGGLEEVRLVLRRPDASAVTSRDDEIGGKAGDKEDGI